ncbi:hypothetical protein SEA_PHROSTEDPHLAKE_48 [Gordonia phage PhrostedPhlake]|nr:hypothetical protein SEA_PHROSTEDPHLAKE_48 [Gordonia phage PhrostedPhlake]
MSAGTVELVRGICTQHPDLSVQIGFQPNPDYGSNYTTVAVLNLPGHLFPAYESGDYNSETRLSVSGPDEGTSVLAVTRYHDDDVDAALQSALDYITAAQAGVVQ